MAGAASADDPPCVPFLQIAQSPQQWTARDWFVEGCRRHADDDIAGAIEAFRLSLMTETENPEAHYYLAECLYRQRKVEAALERYYVGAEEDHEYLEAWIQIGSLHRELGEPDPDEPDGTPRVWVKALAYRSPDDAHPGVGWSWMVLPGSTPYTRGSELENTETSAWGRAIGALGIGIDKSIASGDEVKSKEGESDRKEPITRTEDGGLVIELNPNIPRNRRATILVWEMANAYQRETFDEIGRRARSGEIASAREYGIRMELVEYGSHRLHRDVLEDPRHQAVQPGLELDLLHDRALGVSHDVDEDHRGDERPVAGFGRGRLHAVLSSRSSASPSGGSAACG